MTKNPVVVDIDQSVEFTIEILLQGEFHAIPVISKDQLVGIINAKDILESMTNNDIINSNQ